MSSSITPPTHGQPRKSALKTEDEGASAVPTNGPIKAVHIAEPPHASADEAQPKKHFTAGVAKRLSGRLPPPASQSKAVPGQTGLENLSAAVRASPSVEASEDSGSSATDHRLSRAGEKLVSQVADWLRREKTKRSNRRAEKVNSHRQSPAPDRTTGSGVAATSRHHRSGSIDSESSEASLDKLQRIIDESMAAFGLKTLPHLSPRLGRKHHKKAPKPVALSRAAASSDTEFFDGDALVPSCDVYLDNTKAASHSGGGLELTDKASCGKKDDIEQQAWVTFKNEVIRLAHTLKLKGWRRVPLDAGHRIYVERLSGALTNAVYVVCPPDDLPPPQGKKQPGKVLLRLYGPQVDIDRDNELSVLRRLARKKIGPRLLGTFVNGRFEQFFNAATLTPAAMREPETSKQIAKRMRELHDGVELLPDERLAGPQVWRNWDRWAEHVGRTVRALDNQVVEGARGSSRQPREAWADRGFVCGVEWHAFKAMVDKYRKYLDDFYGSPTKIHERLVFSHNDTQYGNILRLRPENSKSPLLQPANEHKQLIVIDFEYAGANVPGLEFANHFTEWAYNYHDPAAPFACNVAAYPKPEEQYRFIKAYVNHRPQYTHGFATPVLSPLPSPMGSTPSLHRAASTSSIREFMLDVRLPAAAVPGAGASAVAAEEDEEASSRAELSDRRVRELVEEARLWRIANSVQWIAWGVVQAKIPGPAHRSASEPGGEPRAGPGGGDAASCEGEGRDGPDEAGEEFDYLAYAQERAFFFWGDCVLAGLARAEDLPRSLRERLKLIQY